ncbi:unnamed protein product [Protopolystoma xenopodis]|uniref:Uncharacterized protein n=1 Tax=Protopolystoma xenopodis TaxID=117903 RepID=A0A3S4ZQS3_9PLAT|nr:unnamed protein product [Protopolystoma xenopodis]
MPHVAFASAPESEKSGASGSDRARGNRSDRSRVTQGAGMGNFCALMACRLPLNCPRHILVVTTPPLLPQTDSRPIKTFFLPRRFVMFRLLSLNPPKSHNQCQH